jgi:hypothetical protein
MCWSAKREILSGTHDYNHIFKIALIKSGAVGVYGSGSTSYTNLGSDEVANGSGYTTGGNTLTGITYALTNGTASIDWADSQWTSASISAEGAMVYNASLSSSASLAVYSFGGVITSTSGTFTVQIPSSGEGVIRLS